jgi:hypothetical protein
VYFSNVFVQKISKMSGEDIGKTNFDPDFLTLFPEDVLASGEDFEKI